MYIHRIVIDANRINTRGTILAMTELEAYHAAGLLEIFQTSTLPVEFRNWEPGRVKASGYTVVGGSYRASVSTIDGHDSTPGTASSPSRLADIHRIIFGEPSAEQSHRVHDLRDALHIDQANQNDADFFLTHEDAILKASARLRSAGVETYVCSAESCLETVQNYFSSAHGTTVVSHLRGVLDHAGTILIGSNSCGGTEFVDCETGESLLSFVRIGECIAIAAKFRAGDGRLVLEITPGASLKFPTPAVRVHAEIGPSLFLLGDQACRSFSVTDNSNTALVAGRMLNNSRLMIYRLTMHNGAGRLAIQVQRSDLLLAGINVIAAP